MQSGTRASAGQAAGRPAGDGSSTLPKLPGAQGKGWGMGKKLRPRKGNPAPPCLNELSLTVQVSVGSALHLPTLRGLGWPRVEPDPERGERRSVLAVLIVPA